MVEIVNKILAVLTVGGQISIILGLIYFLFNRKDKNNRLINFFANNGLVFAFLVALVSVASSLFYSDIAGFEPCRLCWFQRIFMYPQIFLLGLAWLREEDFIIDYSLLLAGVGTLFSVYHNYIYYGGSPLIPCSAFGLGVSCTTRYVQEFGYITIPLMALTGFILFLGFLFLKKWSRNNSIS